MPALLGATAVQRITPSRPGHEYWTLRCKSCGHVHQMQVVSSTSQSESLDWFEESGLTGMRSDRRSRKKVNFLTADQIEEQADAAASEAKQLPTERRNRMRCIMRHS